MAGAVNRVEAAAVLVTASTAKAAAVTTDVSFQDGIVQWIELTVPDGHFGLTGIQILSANGQAIPYTFGEYIVADDYTKTFDLVGQIDTGSWQAKCYNTDIFDHTFYLRFGVLDFGYAPASQPIPPLSTPPLLV